MVMFPSVLRVWRRPVGPAYAKSVAWGVPIAENGGIPRFQISGLVAFAYLDAKVWEISPTFRNRLSSNLGACLLWAISLGALHPDIVKAKSGLAPKGAGTKPAAFAVLDLLEHA
ncbi:hypothetical protein [Novosphingobium sediminis]|nr:hypothetical protein [Novosphingobium sediminis]